MSETTITRRSALVNGTLFLGAGLAGIRPEPVAAESPAAEAAQIAERIESLMLNELRWDEEARSAFMGWSMRIYDLATAVDAQSPPHGY